MYKLKRLLVIYVSPQKSASSSKKLARYFVSRLKITYPNEYKVIYRNLDKSYLPYINSKNVELFNNNSTNTKESKEFESLSEKYIKELKNSDAIVLATPMHNFTIPTCLRAYFDLVLRLGKTFFLSPNGFLGLLSDRPLIVISCAAGNCHFSCSDFLTPYIKYIFNFIGIQKFYSVYADGLAREARRADALLQARILLEKHVEVFHTSQNNNY